MKRLILLYLFFSFSLYSSAQKLQEVVPYTLADRDRAIRTEVKMESMEARINDLQSKFDSYFIWGFGMVLMSIFGLDGFIFYDRRETLKVWQTLKVC